MNMLKNNEKKENKTKQFKIYAHVNKVNGKIYIGQTCRKPENRWANGQGYKKNPHFWNAIQKYGWNNFDHIILFEVNDQDLANISEHFLIQKYQSNNPIFGYNVLSGGSNLCGENNPNYGNKYSDQTKKKLSEIQKKRLSDKRNHPRYGVHLSEETKNKIRLGNSKKYSEEQRINKLLSDKTIHKISLYDKQLNYIKTFLCVYDAKKYVGKDFYISFSKKPFYIDNKYILIFDDVYDETIHSEDFINAINNYGIRKNQRMVICLNDLKIYESISEASKDKKCHTSDIIRCCTGERKCGGSDPILGKLMWEYYDKSKTYEKKTYKKKTKKCLCITTDELFDSTKEASDAYNINQRTIVWACNPNNGNNRTNGGNTFFDHLFWKYA